MCVSPTTRWNFVAICAFACVCLLQYNSVAAATSNVSKVRECRTASELVSAISDQRVSTALLKGLVTLQEKDVHGTSFGVTVARKPVFTIGTGSTRSALDFGNIVSAIIVPPGHTLVFKEITVTGIAPQLHQSNKKPAIQSSGLGSWPSLVVEQNATVVFDTSTIYYPAQSCSSEGINEVRQSMNRRFGEGSVTDTGDGGVYLAGSQTVSLQVRGGENYSQVLGNYTLDWTNVTGRCYSDPLAPPFTSSLPESEDPPIPQPINDTDNSEESGSVSLWIWLLIGCGGALVLVSVGVVSLVLWRRRCRGKALELIDQSDKNMEQQRRDKMAVETIVEKRQSDMLSAPSSPSAVTTAQHEVVMGMLKAKCDAPEGVEVGPLIGRGGFGRVYKGRWGGSLVAVKIVEQPMLETDAAAHSLKEADVISTTLTHPNVVSTYRVWSVVLQQQSGDNDVGQQMAVRKAAALEAQSSSGDPKSSIEGGSSIGGSSAGRSTGAPLLRDARPQQQQGHSTAPSTSLALPTVLQDHSMSACGGTRGAPTQGPAPGDDGHMGSGAPASQPGDAQNYVREGVPYDQAATSEQMENPRVGIEGIEQGCEAGEEAELGGCQHVFDSESIRVLLQTWMLLEYCDRGSLCEAIVAGKLKKKLTGEAAMVPIYRCLLDIAGGMDYLHSLGVVHGDLKPSNVLLKSTAHDPRGYTCKIADFGLSRVFDLHHSHTFTETLGTLAYMPPELVATGKLTKAADVYAFAMIAWELLTGQLVTSCISLGQLFLHIMSNQQRPPLPSTSPQAYTLLLHRCWDSQPQNRPTFSEILQELHVQYKTLREAHST